jgi:MFS family permease
MNSEQEGPPGVPEELRRNSIVIKLLMSSFLIGLGAGFIIPLFTYYWEAVFSLSQTSVTILTMIAYIGLALASLFTPWIAAHAKTLGGRVGTIVAFEGASIVCAAYLAIAPFQMALYPAIVAYASRTVLMNAVSPLTSALLMDHSPIRKRGLYNSYSSIANAVPNSVSPIFTYFIYASAKPPYGFTFPIFILVFLYIMSTIIYATIRKADNSFLSKQGRTIGTQKLA